MRTLRSVRSAQKFRAKNVPLPAMSSEGENPIEMAREIELRFQQGHGKTAETSS
jgi:hypothetical protein